MLWQLNHHLFSSLTSGITWCTTKPRPLPAKDTLLDDLTCWEIESGSKKNTRVCLVRFQTKTSLMLCSSERITKVLKGTDAMMCEHFWNVANKKTQATQSFTCLLYLFFELKKQTETFLSDRSSDDDHEDVNIFDDHQWGITYDPLPVSWIGMCRQSKTLTLGYLRH